MKEIKFTRTFTVYALLAVGLSTAPAALGQTVQKEPLMRSFSVGSMQLTTPKEVAILAAFVQAQQLAHEADASLHADNYAKAEDEARESLAVANGGFADEVLAAALDAQGKEQEALQAYKVMVVDEKAGYPRVLLPYAQLLLKSGQWAQAVAVYNQALPQLPDIPFHTELSIVHDGDLIRANSYFSPDVPEPEALATALHITRGIIYSTTNDWECDSQDKEAMGEYAQALQLAPDNALANYYYGVGWHKLSPVARAKFGNAKQAKAALQKAVKFGPADVKAAAKALTDAG